MLYHLSNQKHSQQVTQQIDIKVLQDNAGIAQLVERVLAKHKVESSSLFSRSSITVWRSGSAGVSKTLSGGSIPSTVAKFNAGLV